MERQSGRGSQSRRGSAGEVEQERQSRRGREGERERKCGRGRAGMAESEAERDAE